MNSLVRKIWNNQESLSKIEGKLFAFYQNLKFKRDITTKSKENAIVIPEAENAEYLTFQLNYSKNIKLNEHVKLALFIWMMPQFLDGKEFDHIDPESEELIKSPRGQLSCILTKCDNKYYTYVDVEGCWTCFSDNYVHQLSFYENVIEQILKDMHVPLTLIYKVWPWLIQRPNPQVRQMLSEYMSVVISKKAKRSMKSAHPSNIKFTSTFGDKEEEKLDHDKDTSSENEDRKLDSPDDYKDRGIKRSITEEKIKNKNKKIRSSTNRFWWF